MTSKEQVPPCPQNGQPPARMPSWQTAPCPDWCTWTDHEEDDHPEDRNHYGAQKQQPLSLHPPVKYWNDNYGPKFMNLFLWQHFREVEPSAQLALGDDEPAFRLTLDEAEQVGRALLQLVKQARGTSR